MEPCGVTSAHVRPGIRAASVREVALGGLTGDGRGETKLIGGADVVSDGKSYLRTRDQRPVHRRGQPLFRAPLRLCNRLQPRITHFSSPVANHRPTARAATVTRVRELYQISPHCPAAVTADVAVAVHLTRNPASTGSVRR